MLESELKKNTAAVEANTAALLNGSAPAAATVATPKPSTAKAEPVAEPPADEASATIKEVTAKVLALGKKLGRQAAVSMLAEYGATKVPELKKDPSKYDEIVAKIDALLAA